MYPMTHEQYLEEPAQVVDWALAFAGLEAKLEEKQIERAKAEAQNDHRR